jgi:hypothetical protein
MTPDKKGGGNKMTSQEKINQIARSGMRFVAARVPQTPQLTAAGPVARVKQEWQPADIAAAYNMLVTLRTTLDSALAAFAGNEAELWATIKRDASRIMLELASYLPTTQADTVVANAASLRALALPIGRNWDDETLTAAAAPNKKPRKKADGAGPPLLGLPVGQPWN